MLSTSLTTVLFDLDGTLCTYQIEVEEALDQASKAHGLDGIPFTYEEYSSEYADHFARIMETPTRDPREISFREEVFSNLLREKGLKDKSFISRLVRDYTEIRESALELLPEAETTVKQLRKRFKVALLTNGPSDVQWRKIHALDIEDWFDEIIVAGDHDHYKPDPRIFRTALQRLGASAQETVYIGNSLDHDIKGGNKAGLTTIWKSEEGKELGPDDPQPDATIERLGELLEEDLLSSPLSTQSGREV